MRLSPWPVRQFSRGLSHHSNRKTQPEEQEEQIIIITYKDKQLVTSLFLTPSFFLTPSLLTFTPSVLPHPASSSHLSPPPPLAPLSLRVNSDHVWHFIGSLHFSPLLRLMGCLAINEHAKTWTGPRSGKGYVHTNTHTHTYGHSHAPSLLVAECQSRGPGKGHYFGYMEAYTHHTQKIYAHKHTHAGTTLSVTSGSVCCGSVTSTLLTASSDVFCLVFQQRKVKLLLLQNGSNWYFEFHAVNLHFIVEIMSAILNAAMLLNCSENKTKYFSMLLKCVLFE